MRTYLPPTADRPRLEAALQRVLATGCVRLGMQHGAVVTAAGEIVACHNQFDDPDAVGNLLARPDMVALRLRTLVDSEVVALHDRAEAQPAGFPSDASSHGAYLGIALHGDNGPFGTLCLCSEIPRDFTEAELSVVALLGELAAEQVAMEALRAALATKQSLLAAIAEVQSNFVATMDGPRAFAELLERTLSVTGKSNGVIAEVSRDEGGEPTVRVTAASHGYSSADLGELIKAVQRALPGAESDRHTQVDGHLVLPVSLHGDLVGVIALVTGTEAFTPEAIADLDPLLATTGHLLDMWRQAEEQRQVQRQVALLSRVASQMPVGVVVTDPAGRIRWANDSLLHTTGFVLGELVGQRPRDVIHAPDADPARLAAVNDAMAGRQGFTVEMLCRTRDDGRFWAEVTAHPLYASDQTDEGYLVMMVDISERMRAEELERATERAEAATRAKSEFVAHMSHEIRTPLNAIVGFSQLLARTSLDDRQRELVGKSQRAADILGTTISNILDFSKIEAGALVLERTPFALAGVVDGVQSVAGGLAERKGIGFRVAIGPHAPPVVIGDPVRVQQILMNLAGNAVKFTERGTVDISVDADAHGAGGYLLRFTVSDTGIGIPPEVHSSLFESFSQAESSTTRRFGGTGLGLSISKRLVDLMGGTIVVSSTVGRGSAFTFSLPMAVSSEIPANVSEVEVRSDASMPLLGRRILLAEDNEFNQEVARELLEQVGARVDVAADGAAALEMVAGGAGYDVILMDVQMPLMDGLEATRAIRRLPDVTRIPIIAMTANAMSEDANECYAAGMDDFESKPIDLNRLVQTILRWLP